jgi:hypothetical protein
VIGGTETQVAAQREALLKKLEIESDAQLMAAANALAPWGIPTSENRTAAKERHRPESYSHR